ncbi:hypothetical protein NUH86_15975 [Sphingobium sp. JS3065]|uniref:hypothetical protein n=1 Tax=Sphingobium sp. JS3065 TaxID=2970925 RepID=UPI002264118B|nr:hypothetical protein [Sphingobium sp. JS3065]UZW54952.1 hypothetical protein NUH86_15975 [Sphingobium sp. JS3065]
MKLIVKIVDAAGAPGGRALLLCDERGESLPNQVALSLNQSGPADLSRVSVEFVIDGKQIAFDDGKVMVSFEHEASLFWARELIADAVAYGAGIVGDPERKRPADFRTGDCDNGDLIRRAISGPTSR